MKKNLFTLALAVLTIGLLGSCKKEDPKVSVTGVTLDKTTLEITVGDPDVKLTATVAPENATDKTVSWSSDKTEFATVDNEGNVHAVAPGIATITVTTTDGNKTATCAVTVKAAKVSVTGVTLDRTELTLTVGDPDVKLTATVAPDDATDKTVSWSSDKTDVATVDAEGNVHAAGPGTATITVTTTDGGKTATCVVTVTRIVVDITKTIVGAEDCSTSFRGDHSQFFQVPAGQLLHFEFTNHTSKINTWNNWNLVMATTPGTSVDDDPAYAELFVIKSDQSGSGNADYSNERLKIDYFEDGNLADWDEFKEFMDGTHVTIEVDHTTAGYAYITATATNNGWGISITESYNQKVGTDDIYANITTDLSYFQMLSAYRTISKIDEISD